ncbi:Patatin-like phospholipase family protein [Rhodovastum atsumiense]|nr:patatin-like phospholipase family protein [Rhodovastum atsumiense]CAH2604261.1 Patatin-like phospholipase family protein [Rhodovastum atsumiense]
MNSKRAAGGSGIGGPPTATHHHIPPPGRPEIVLVLQGGGALGSYHIGAYEALAEAGLHPDWVCAISIGAVNGALIAGSPPEQRVARMLDFWEAISRPEVVPRSGLQALRIAQNWANFGEALLFGQPNFFLPRPFNPWLAPDSDPQSVSFYDTNPLLFTLVRFADFDTINTPTVRLSLGVTDIADGRLTFFDNRDRRIGPEHVLASGSLPPAFAATAVEGGYYWDGACVANTPLDAVLNDPAPVHRVVFMLDLWSGPGPVPRNIAEAIWRAKQIQYASRTPRAIDAAATKVNLCHALRTLKTAGGPAAASIAEEAAPAMGRLDFVHVTYQQASAAIPYSDAEFSRASIATHRSAGYRDIKAALAAAPWRDAPLPPHLGALVHRVSAEQVTTLPPASLSLTAGDPAFAPPALPVPVG